MGLRAACSEKEGGVPAWESPYLSVGGKRAPLPRMRPSPRPEPLLGGGVFMKIQCPRGRAVPLGASSAGACRDVPGGDLLVSLHPPHPAVGGRWVG